MSHSLTRDCTFRSHMITEFLHENLPVSCMMAQLTSTRFTPAWALSWHLHECLMISWVTHWTHVAGFSRAMNCSVQAAAASKADVNAHGIPKGAHSGPSQTYLQASSRLKRKRHMEGEVPEESYGGKHNRQGWSGAESPSKLRVKELQTQAKQKAQLMFRMWSNVQNSWAIWCTILLPRLRNTCIASREHSSPHILCLEKALQLFESWTYWYLQLVVIFLVQLLSSALYARV